MCLIGTGTNIPIESIITQTYQKLDIILINDGSEDRSLEICKKFQKKDKRIRVFSQKNKGVSRARNYGIEISKGKYLTFVDADDLVHPKFIEVLLEGVYNNKCDVSICMYKRFIDGERIDTSKTKIETQYEIIERRDALALLNEWRSDESVAMVIPCIKLYKKELFQNIKFPEGLRHEDEFVAHQLLNKCSRISKNNSSLYYYRWNLNSYMGDMNNQKSLEHLVFFRALVQRIVFYSINEPSLVSGAVHHLLRECNSFYDEYGKRVENIYKKKKKWLVYVYAKEYRKYFHLLDKGERIKGFLFIVNPKLYHALALLKFMEQKNKKDMDALVSVIIPVYNVEKYLRRCLDSICRQTYKNMEIILVDDGSTDDSGIICDEYSKRDQRIKVLHKVNGGLSDARNQGIEASTGDYISFIDSDDFVQENFIEILFNNLKKTHSQISACGYQRFYDENLIIKKEVENKIETWSSRETILELTKTGDHRRGEFVSVMWNKLFDRALFQKIRFPVGKIHEDEFVILHLLLETTSFCRCLDELYYYRQRSDSITGNDTCKDPKHLQMLDAYKERCELTNTEKYRDIYQEIVENYFEMMIYGAFEICNSIKIFLNLYYRYIRELFFYRKWVKQKRYFLFAICPGLYWWRYWR